MPDFHVADEDAIKRGETTDVYFVRTMEVLTAEGRADRRAWAEFTTSALPEGWPWGVFCGLEEAVRLMEGRDVDLYAIPEGTVFRTRGHDGVPVPVMVLDGPYGAYCVYETPLLGLLCQATGIATKAARIRMAAGDATVLSFGIRRMHPALAPMIDRAAYIGGCDDVSSLAGAKAIGREPRGTMPHALTILMGGPKEAFLAFDRRIDRQVPRVALVDTYFDEVREAITAAESVPDLAGVRLDTPSSRRGDFPALVREVRWELDLRGYQHVKIVVSGGLDEDNIPALRAAGADRFGVGTSISNAPTVNFAMDVVEVEGVPAAKRAKFGGKKYVYRCPEDFTFEVSTGPPSVCACGTRRVAIQQKYLDGGKLVEELPTPTELRNSVTEQLKKVTLGGSR